MSEIYAMASGSLDQERLRILNKYYNSGSTALLKKAGVFECIESESVYVELYKLLQFVVREK